MPMPQYRSDLQQESGLWPQGGASHPSACERKKSWISCCSCCCCCCCSTRAQASPPCIQKRLVDGGVVQHKMTNLGETRQVFQFRRGRCLQARCRYGAEPRNSVSPPASSRQVGWRSVLGGRCVSGPRGIGTRRQGSRVKKARSGVKKERLGVRKKCSGVRKKGSGG